MLSSNQYTLFQVPASFQQVCTLSSWGVSNRDYSGLRMFRNCCDHMMVVVPWEVGCRWCLAPTQLAQCVHGVEGKLRFQLLLLIYFLKTLLPVEWVGSMDQFMKKANNEYVYRLTSLCSDFNVQVLQLTLTTLT